jgi:hypothetical protein
MTSIEKFRGHINCHNDRIDIGKYRFELCDHMECAKTWVTKSVFPLYPEKTAEDFVDVLSPAKAIKEITLLTQE